MNRGWVCENPSSLYGARMINWPFSRRVIEEERMENLTDPKEFSLSQKETCSRLDGGVIKEIEDSLPTSSKFSANFSRGASEEDPAARGGTSIPEARNAKTETLILSSTGNREGKGKLSYKAINSEKAEKIDNANHDIDLPLESLHHYATHQLGKAQFARAQVRESKGGQWL
ncbi:hypothetical protein VNO77_16254 [Canavalia gladiata]|uniref:Uncharacterized protein n=1 Tax=Canavalia gladiata TaxID=3824 RepID=A0AAN9M0P7_CANGL